MKWWDEFKRKRALKLAQKALPVKKGKVALCLGGGGARGFAHIGAIKAFNEEGIDFDLVAGTSVGSLIGALYSAGVSADEMMAFGDKLEMKDLKVGNAFGAGNPLSIGKIVTDLIGEKEFKDLQKPFYAVATDLVSAREIILDSGSVATAVSASCAVPIIFNPVSLDGMNLVDGGVKNNIPADVCRMMGADFVITVDVNPTRGKGTSKTSRLSVIKATFNIMSAGASEKGLINSDIIIAPDLSQFSASKKDGHDEMYRLGYEETKKSMDEIKALIYKGVKNDKKR
ncbi:MAG: patatin-like phospholipase family protein [Clostridia bacterium]|nr:patatin-like phospholipase family protein [Clostridia bacterium]